MLSRAAVTRWHRPWPATKCRRHVAYLFKIGHRPRAACAHACGVAAILIMAINRLEAMVGVASPNRRWRHVSSYCEASSCRVHGAQSHRVIEAIIGSRCSPESRSIPSLRKYRRAEAAGLSTGGTCPWPRSKPPIVQARTNAAARSKVACRLSEMGPIKIS